MYMRTRARACGHTGLCTYFACALHACFCASTRSLHPQPVPCRLGPFCAFDPAFDPAFDFTGAVV